MIDEAFTELREHKLTSARAACRLLGKPRSTHYRRRRPASPAPEAAPTPQPMPRPGNALSKAERARVLEVLHSERFADKAPAQVWATLLDEGVYLCSESTMYRLLRANGEVRERRRQARHPAKVKPELAASTPRYIGSP